MMHNETLRVESESAADFAHILEVRPAAAANHSSDGTAARLRLSIEPENVKNGLGQLVLTLVKLLHELMERQAIRRIDGGSLTAAQIERLGLTLMRQAEEIQRLRIEFGLEEKDLNLELGPLGRLL